MLPQLTPVTALGAAGAAAYASRVGLDNATYFKQLEPVLTPELAGRGVLELATSDSPDPGAFLLTRPAMKAVTTS